MKMYKHLTKSSGIAMLSLMFFLYLSPTNAQEVRDAALAQGIKFGSPIMEIDDPANAQLYRDNMSVATVTTYWKSNTHPYEGVYNWGRSDARMDFAEANNWDIHGHPLVWGEDALIPDWVLNKPLHEAEGIMLDHIRTVVGRYRGRVDVWDVVNEAIDYFGNYRYCYWNKAMTGEYIIKAFREAHAADPDAKLIYNDYHIETNLAKFETVKGLLGWIQSSGTRIDGLGWQLHIANPDLALDPNFPLEQRMQEISDMGLKNYVTELDIRIPDNSDYWLERQKQAYKKVAEIFLRNPTRGEYFQTWDLSDKYTWYDLFDNQFDEDNIVDHPLPFDRNNNKKPAYWGLFEAFTGSTPPPPPTQDRFVGELRIRNLWSNTYLNENDNSVAANTSLQGFVADWYSMRWNVEQATDGSYRLRSGWGGNYLNSSNTFNDAPVNVFSYQQNWTSQMWYIQDAGNGLFRLQNRWTGKYLHTSNQSDVQTHDLNPNWWSQLWVFEYIDGRNLKVVQGEAIDLIISPNPAVSTIQLTGIHSPLDYQIYDISGKIVLQGTAQTVDVSTLANGTYLLVAYLKDENGAERFARGTFIKQ